ncbi:hypothetical protein HID58_093650 [Brassica napus]|uniref:RNA-dependent RNA polymerase n=1 Tax=Brassica napus TaxID=3708 RepID=A0ABQ7XA92_BRANA|nr:hypothetical protein HID58_093650 [Brassica napus]
MEVRQLFESITGSGTIHAIRHKKTKHGEKFYALVQFAQETHANKLLTQSTEVNTPYRLNFHEWKYEIDSKDKASMEHYIDGLLMHFGFLATPEKFKYLYSVGCSFGSGNQNLHFSAHLSEDYIGRISWHLSQEKDSKLLLIQLKGGPKIYENQNQHVDPEYEKLNFCRGGFDNYRFYINLSNRSVICHCLKVSPMRVFLPQVLILLFISFLIPKHLIDRAFIDYALPKLLSLGKCPYDHIAWLTKEYLEWGKKEKPTESTLDYQHGLFDILSFVDENLKTLSCNDLSPRSSVNRKTKVYDRIYSVLSDGVVIGKKKFEFLAYSASQLKSTSTWMFAPIDGIKAADIRSWMGDFGSIKNVSKYAARLGQSFGSSKETLTVKADDVELIPDVEIFSSGKRYVFSDGIGKISSDFAELVARKCDIEGVSPSAFQIRYGGYKGVVAKDPNSSKKLSLRSSMRKFHSDHTKLDVLAWTKEQPCYLNRQMITLLSTLGVSDSVFEKKQKEVVDTLDFVLTDPMKILCLMPPREHTKFLKDLVSCGIKPSEPFLSMMLHYIRESKLVELRTKTRIIIPKGRSMMGCMDETNTLEYGQVFVRCSYSTNLSLTSESSPTQDPTLTLDSKPPYNIIGDVVVAKSPCLHPGDVRVLKAIAVTDLNHMTDCIVFPQKGHRPHPNECSGSDLDGDLYFVSWDPELIPPNTYEPMDYTAEEPQALDHEVTIQEITNHFTNYPLNNNVGTISNLHKVFADKEGEKAGSKQCLELAKMFSAAVDFPKTGVEVKIPPHLYVKEYPDFMENQNKLAYKSKTVIGKLFRELKKLGPPSISSTSSTPLSHDKDLVFMGFQNHIELATDYKKSYDSKLRHLMDTFGIETEAEIVCRGMGMTEPFTESGEMIEKAFRSLTKEALSWFIADEGVDELAKASAWYIVTNYKDYVSTDCLESNQLWSFPWCVYDRLLKIKMLNNKAEVCEETH